MGGRCLKHRPWQTSLRARYALDAAQGARAGIPRSAAGAKEGAQSPRKRQTLHQHRQRRRQHQTRRRTSPALRAPHRARRHRASSEARVPWCERPQHRSRRYQTLQAASILAAQARTDNASGSIARIEHQRRTSPEAPSTSTTPASRDYIARVQPYRIGDKSSIRGDQGAAKADECPEP